MGLAQRSPAPRKAGKGYSLNGPQPVAGGSRFFAISASLIGALVVLSFPLSYFFPVANGSKSFSLLHHLHGPLFFVWVRHDENRLYAHLWPPSTIRF